MTLNIYQSSRKDNITMSSSLGINEGSFGNPPGQVSSQAFEGDVRGGAVKPSDVLGGIAGIAGPLSVLSPATAIVTAPIAAIAGIGSAIAKLFGGGLTQSELNMLMQIKERVDQRRDLRGVTGSPSN